MRQPQRHAKKTLQKLLWLLQVMPPWTESVQKLVDLIRCASLLMSHALLLVPSVRLPAIAA